MLQADEAAVHNEDAMVERLTDRNGDQVGVALIFEPLVSGAGMIVVDTNNGGVAPVLAIEDALLDRNVARHVAMAI